MPKLQWKMIPAWLLVAFFLVGGIGNIFVSTEIAADYRRWGYPDWFHYVTAGLELTAAGSLAFRKTRLFGVTLASAIMLAAAATVLLNGEYTHAIAPLTILGVLILAGLISWQKRPG